MRSFLLQPYPFSDNAARRLAVCAGVGLFITLFLAVFKPFGFDKMPVGTQWLHAVLFGIVTFVFSSFFQVALPRIVPRFFREEGWRSWKEIVYLLLTTAFIGVGNFVLMRILYPSQTTLAGFLKTQLITFEVGIFPVLFVVFFKQLRLYRRFAADASEATKEIQVVHEEDAIQAVVLPQLILLRGDNQKEELSVLAEDLFCISSADNYVKIQFREAGSQKSVLFRSTLKRMEDQLLDYPGFFRCHRMHLVNLNLVTDVSGNAQGLKLHLKGLQESVPVSRGLTETVKEKLHGLSRSPQKA